VIIAFFVGVRASCLVNSQTSVVLKTTEVYAIVIYFVYFELCVLPEIAYKIKAFKINRLES